MNTTELNFKSFVIEYLGEIEKEFENTLACLSGAHMGSNHAKNGGRQSRDTLPLITMLLLFCTLNYHVVVIVYS